MERERLDPFALSSIQFQTPHVNLTVRFPDAVFVPCDKPPRRRGEEMNEQNEGRLVSIQEAARRLGVSVISAYRWAESGRLPSVKLGGRRMISSLAIDRIVRAASGEEGAA